MSNRDCKCVASEQVGEGRSELTPLGRMHGLAVLRRCVGAGLRFGLIMLALMSMLPAAGAAAVAVEPGLRHEIEAVNAMTRNLSNYLATKASANASVDLVVADKLWDEFGKLKAANPDAVAGSSSMTIKVLREIGDYYRRFAAVREKNGGDPADFRKRELDVRQYSVSLCIARDDLGCKGPWAYPRAEFIALAVELFRLSKDALDLFSWLQSLDASIALNLVAVKEWKWASLEHCLAGTGRPYPGVDVLSDRKFVCDLPVDCRDRLSDMAELWARIPRNGRPTDTALTQMPDALAGCPDSRRVAHVAR